MSDTKLYAITEPCYCNCEVHDDDQHHVNDARYFLGSTSISDDVARVIEEEKVYRATNPCYYDRVVDRITASPINLVEVKATPYLIRHNDAEAPPRPTVVKVYFLDGTTGNYLETDAEAMSETIRVRYSP
jgi:hypothetical protein